MASVVATVKNWLVTKESHFIADLESDIHLVVGEIKEVSEEVAKVLEKLEGVKRVEPAATPVVPEPVAVPPVVEPEPVAVAVVEPDAATPTIPA